MTDKPKMHFGNVMCFDPTPKRKRMRKRRKRASAEAKVQALLDYQEKKRLQST